MLGGEDHCLAMDIYSLDTKSFDEKFRMLSKIILKKLESAFLFSLLASKIALF